MAPILAAADIVDTLSLFSAEKNLSKVFYINTKFLDHISK